MVHLKKEDVYTNVSVQEAYAKTGKALVGVRWVDVSKGDDADPDYRSGLVAKDTRKKGGEMIFAPTPPLESLRALLSLGTSPDSWMSKTPQWEGERRSQVSFIDISRPYFHARTDPSRPVHVHLPSEDEDQGKGLRGKLNVDMFGTRHAADGWCCECPETLGASGLVCGESSACVFRDPEEDLISCVHRGDCTTVGPKSFLDFFKQQLELKYELKEAARLGPGGNDDKEGSAPTGSSDGLKVGWSTRATPGK